MSHIVLKDSEKKVVLVKSYVTGTSVEVRVVAPIANLNGAAVDSLLHQQHVVCGALDILRKALSDAAPHGRDFQISPAGDNDKAREDHLTEVDMLNVMCARHEEIYRQLYNQKVG
jgi:hypothetical protein